MYEKSAPLAAPAVHGAGGSSVLQLTQELRALLQALPRGEHKPSSVTCFISDVLLWNAASPSVSHPAAFLPNQQSSSTAMPLVQLPALQQPRAVRNAATLHSSAPTGFMFGESYFQFQRTEPITKPHSCFKSRSCGFRHVKLSSFKEHLRLSGFSSPSSSFPSWFYGFCLSVFHTITSCHALGFDF